MKKEYIFKDTLNGGKAIITINDNILTISRPGIMSKIAHGFTGDKTLLINQISAVQFKPVKIARGFIQFILAGSKEAKASIIVGNTDENIIYFEPSFNNKKVNEQALEIKNYIEQYNTQKETTVLKEEDKYDKLSKLKKLLDDNVITQEEFEIEKRNLLK